MRVDTPHGPRHHSATEVVFMPRLALLLVLLLALPLAADTPPPAAPSAPPPVSGEKPRPEKAPAPPGDEGELDEFVPSENVPADTAVAFPNDI